jgi:DNA-binding transcriptional regulator of glucitol operon
MSLRQFHLLFVTIVTCLFLGLGGWSLTGYYSHQGGLLLWLGAGFFAAALLVVVYGAWFLRKTRRMGLVE